MRNLFLIFLFILSFVYSDSNHQFNHLSSSNNSVQNATSNNSQKRPKLEEIYDEDEFDTTGVDIDALDLTNVNTGNRNIINPKSTEYINDPQMIKEKESPIKNNKQQIETQSDKLELIKDRNNQKEEDQKNTKLSTVTNINDNNGIVHYDSEKEMNLNNINDIYNQNDNSLEHIDGPYKKKSKRRYNGIGGMNDQIGGNGNMGGSMGDYGHMGKMNMNNFQNFNNPNDKGFFHHIYEIMMCFFLIMFFYNLICGKSNYKLTQNWFEANKDFFKQNYKKIGISEDLLAKLMKRNEKGLSLLDEEKKDEKKVKKRKINPFKEKIIQETKPKKEKKPKVNILQQDMNVLKFFAFKKNNVKQMIINFEYRRSNDYFSTFSGGIFNNERDHMIYQFSLNTFDEIPTVFCLCRGVEAKTFKKSYPDIDFFTRPYQPSFLSDYHLLFAESSEIFIDVFRNKNLLASFKRIEQYLEILYFTDRKTFTLENQSIYFGFELYMDQFRAKNVYKDINDFVHQFIDELCLIEITEKVKREAAKNRQEYEEINPTKNDSNKKFMQNSNNILNEKDGRLDDFQSGRIIKRKIRGINKKPKEKKKI